MAESVEDLDVDELEQLLLEAENENEAERAAENANHTENSTARPQPKLTVEGSNFLLQDTADPPDADAGPSESAVNRADVDSSEDEDTRNFLERKYNQYGRQINDLLKSKEEEKSDQVLSKWVDQKLRQIQRSTAQAPAPETSPPAAGKSRDARSKPVEQSPKQTIPAVFQATVHTDPVFGMRIVHPLVSSQTLQERMEGKKAVPFARLRNFIETGDLQQDWVIGGVLLSKSPTKTTSKGKQFAIWKLSDLHGEIKMISLFMFAQAYKDLWKTPDGTVVAVLNPNVLNKNNDRNSEATLSIDRSTKLMILGQSRDMGTCRSRKKNGDRCSAIVNLGNCEYCVYHIKQEYGKACNRGGLLTSTGGRGLNELRNKVLGKNEVFYAGQSFSAIKAVKHPKQVAKDRQRMLTLSDYYRSPAEGSAAGSASASPTVPSYRQAANSSGPPKASAARIEHNVEQRLKDVKRLQSLGVSLESLKANMESSKASPVPAASSSTATQPNAFEGRKFSLESKPRLSREAFDIELTQRTPLAAKALQSRERAKAIVKQKPIEKSNPNFIKYRGTEQGKKRVLEEITKNPAVEENAAKRPKVDDTESEAVRARKDHIQRIMKATSSHVDLIEASENAQQEEYFKTLERKEAMEEKMLNTYKMDCKAVICSQCKYVAFSAAERCKTEGHPLRVRDAEKRFFRCADCGNRTVSLFRIPKNSCKSCSGSRWERCAMMRDKRGIQIGDVLSIRGDEEKYLGSLAGASASLNLLMPTEES
ncbi:protein MCM10 homolog [Anopheles bellator]|uniref:protein MCM10 homolog n=1 Tax=Anopheles bellator TaxID=139047 RepID=UPI002649565D|nr:protein MCM10 homolog [Anopheles bellator]